MQRCIALLRGINVGGRNTLPMKQLARDLEALRLANVRTLVQSGNVVFDTTRRATRTIAGSIADAIETGHGFRPQVIVLTRPRLAAIVEANPYRAAESEPTSLHVFFLDAPATAADIPAMMKLEAGSEQFTLTDAALYLHAPDGIGRSKLAARVERLLGVPATARNWRTVCTLLAMADEP